MLNVSIDGLEEIELTLHSDNRGVLAEFFRDDWDCGFHPKQWNLVHSQANAMRGVHLHVGHADYLLPVHGKMLVGVHDARRDSKSFGASALLELNASAPKTLLIPIGVAHGFYCEGEATYLYGMSALWALEGELGCAWNAPELGLDWPASQPILSQRDVSAGDYESMIAAYEAAAQTSSAA